MKTTEIQDGQSFWHNGIRYTAHEDAIRQNQWMVIVVGKDAAGTDAPGQLWLHRDGHVLPA